MWFATRQTLSAVLAGKGTGTARITLQRVNGQVCFKLNWAGIGSPVAAHIHDAGGQAILPLFVDIPKRQGCVKAHKSLITQIAEAPHRYHLRLTTERHPTGALRAQL